MLSQNKMNTPCLAPTHRHTDKWEINIKIANVISHFCALSKIYNFHEYLIDNLNKYKAMYIKHIVKTVSTIVSTIFLKGVMIHIALE